MYLYGAALLGLVMTALNIGTLLRLALGTAGGPTPDFVDPDFARRSAADAVAGIVGWGIVFGGHWWYATSLLRGEGWRAASERRARLRLVYYIVVAIAASAIATVALVWQSASAALGVMLGVERDFASESLLVSIAGPLLALLPWIAAWFVHQRWMVDEAGTSDVPDRPASVGRLAAAAVGLVGISAFAGGAAGAIGLLLDIVLGGNRIEFDVWRPELAGFLAAGLVGVVLWLWNWANLQSRRAAEPEGEARSTVRRAYLLVIVGVALLVSLASLALLLYRLFNAILGVDLFPECDLTVSSALGALLVVGALAAYHGIAGATRPCASGCVPEGTGEIVAETAPVPAPPATVERKLVLRGSSASEVDAAVAALRAGLPPGVELDERPA